MFLSNSLKVPYTEKKNVAYYNLYFILCYIIICVHSAFSLVASCVLLKYRRTDEVNWWCDLISLIYFAGLRIIFANFIVI